MFVLETGLGRISRALMRSTLDIETDRSKNSIRPLPWRYA
jgi:hypothetical protein